MKKLRCKKEYGIWYYKKVMPNDYDDYGEPTYELYDENQKFVGLFDYYSHMKYYVETGEDI